MGTPLGIYGRAGVALGLGWVAGFVDGAVYLLLVQVYTSHMTGNTAALGLYLTRSLWREALRHGWPILAFVAGLMIGALLTEAGRRRRFHSRLSLVLGIEAALLTVLAATDTPGTQNSLWWLGLPALAMGMQTVTITRVGQLRVYATYVTGSLSKFAEALVGYAFWLRDSYRKPGWLRASIRQELLGHALLTSGLWAAFLAGGLSGAWGEARWEMRAMWWPIAALAALIALDLVRPIAAVGENEPLGFRS